MKFDARRKNATIIATMVVTACTTIVHIETPRKHLQSSPLQSTSLGIESPTDKRVYH